MQKKEEILATLKTSLKEGDEQKVSVLRFLLSCIQNKEKAKRQKLAEAGEDDLETKSQLSDEEIIEIISSEIKKAKEALSQFEQGERNDLIEKTKKEIEILSSFLPERLTREELEKLVKAAIEEIGAQTQKDMGKVMSILMPKVKGRAEIVKELLS